MGNELTTTGNILFVLGSLLGIFYFHYWLKTKAETDSTKAVLRAWLMINVAVFFRIGFWVIALVAAPESLKGYSAAGDPLSYTYHPWFVEYKEWITVPTSVLYVWGQISFIHHIENLSVGKRLGLLGVSVVIAGAVMWVGF